jgi:hypothetical protein
VRVGLRPSWRYELDEMGKAYGLANWQRVGNTAGHVGRMRAYHGIPPSGPIGTSDSPTGHVAFQKRNFSIVAITWLVSLLNETIKKLLFIPFPVAC